MAYSDGAALAGDGDLRARLLQCARIEGIENPEAWVAANLGALSASPGWADKWAAATAARSYPLGADPAVISDGDILSAVQAHNQP